MTFNEFILKWQGKYCEVAGSANAKNQCVDLANAYIRDVLGLLIIEWTNAVDFPTKAGDNYEFIKNTLTNIPKEGDIIIWKPSPGHIAIFIEGNVDKFKSFDQNFPIGSACHVQDHTYQNVVGWLHLKGDQSQASDIQIQLAQSNLDRDRNMGWFVDVCTALGVGANVETAVAEAKKLVGLEDAIQQKDRQLQEANTKITDLEAQMANFTTNFNKVVDENSQLSVRVGQQDKLIKELDDQSKNLEKSLYEIKQGIAKPDWSAGELFMASIKKLFGIK